MSPSLADETLTGELSVDGRALEGLPVGGTPEPASEPRPLGMPLRLLLSLAGLQIGFGIVGFLLDQTAPGGPTSAFPRWLHLVHVLAFGAGASLLLLGGRRDRAAVLLGSVFLTRAAAFSPILMWGIVETIPSASGLVSFVASIRVAAFEAGLLWWFVDEFPKVPSFGRWAAFARGMARLSLVIGGVLGGLYFIGDLLRQWSGHTALVALTATPVWLVTLLLLVPAIPYGLWKANRASVEQRFRVKLFLGALLLGLLPMALSAVAWGLVPPYRLFLEKGRNLLLSGFVVYPPLLTIPFTTTWAVLMERVLDVRLTIRKALQYALARYTVLTLLGLPFAGIAAWTFVNRERTVADIATSPAFAVLSVGGAFATILALVRRDLYEWLDRRFFREEYDARRILSALVSRCRSASTVRELSDLLVHDIDDALHLHSIVVYVRERTTARLVARSGRGRPLPLASALATLVAGSAEPFVVDLVARGTPLRRLPEADRHWLADGAYRLLVPLLGSDGDLLGLLALGEKRSELPFSSEDLIVLGTIAAHASLAIESRDRHDPSTPTPIPWGFSGMAGDLPGAECSSCGRVFPSGTVRCASCGERLFPSPLPAVLLGKFLLERRVGAGGMGVVYRGVDVVLGRAVAVKTLPRMAPEAAARLRREARANAAVLHPNLATIYGAETWNGLPVLVFELLEGGTLADRLRSGVLPVGEALAVGVALVDVLERAHDAGVLHRDIKPSNVGFSAENVPKLLDFGLARLVEDHRGDGFGSAPRQTISSGAASRTGPLGEGTRAGVVVGTPSYLPPEALSGAPPGPEFDLWGLSLTIYEALTGSNPLAGGAVEETLKLVTEAKLPPLRASRPECSPGLEAFFLDALSRDPRRRPGSARALRERLSAVVP